MTGSATVGLHSASSSEQGVLDALIVVPVLLGLAWSVKEWFAVGAVKIDVANAPLQKAGSTQVDVDGVVKLMREISDTIAKGAMSFLFAEYSIMAIYIVLFSVLLFFMTNFSTVIAFVVGAVTSIVAGFIGMKIAVKTNVVTTFLCWKDLSQGYAVAIQGGCVMGLSLVCIGIFDLWLLIMALGALSGFTEDEDLYDAIAGYGLGGSSIALFGRVGGGIYTKAADVGADLSGKNDFGLEEDDYRNPACIADNVGDNVGDIAGMGADLFGSFAESTCAALVLAAAAPGLKADVIANDLHQRALMYPVMISSLGVVVGWLTLLLAKVFFPVKEPHQVEKALKGVLIISTVLMSPVVVGLSYWCLPAEAFAVEETKQNVQWWYCAVSILLGLWSGLVIGFVTEYYTSHTYKPVREIAETQKQSAATGIIYGLALGYLSCIIPVICLGITILIAHSLCGMFGVALGALGMLGTMTMGLTIDAYGPISDNAGGIAEMAGLPETVRALTDCLDAAGNTTAAIGKGFAIGSAALVSLALFGAFCTRAQVSSVDVLDPWVFTGLLFGAMMPYAFAAWTMKSVGKAANDMVKECHRQFPKIINENAAPDYEKCIVISTKASLREMIAPGALVILSPLVAGFGFGKNATAGLLSGALVSSVQLAISMSNTGGAWDNSKKYISAGGLGKEFCKGSEAHKNSVTGDTVGDPLKDTSGPALNIVMKLTAIISLVFGAAINNYSNPVTGGPYWEKSAAA
jgi:inorganic pyrophosphatase